MMKTKCLQSFDKKINIEKAIQQTDIQNLDLIGSHVNLSGQLKLLPMLIEHYLKEILNLKNGLLKKYDNIFMIALL